MKDRIFRVRRPDWVRGPRRTDLSDVPMWKIADAHARGFGFDFEQGAGDLSRGDGRAVVTRVIIRGDG